MAQDAWARWGIVLGFGLGGFFDGILLHQILQWHHLLSLVDDVGDLRMQVLWDGYFHALMYVIAAAGLWGLWRAQRQAQEVRGRRLLGALLVGFGLWHIADSILSHWLLGIHRIRLDSPDPLMWDLIWFALFGLVPAAVGWLLLRVRHRGSADLRGSTLVVLLLGLLTAGMAAWSLQPPPGQRFTTIVFAPGVTPAEAIAALASAEARLAWAAPGMDVVIADMPAARRPGLYRRGALLVSGSGLPAGCLGWSNI